jgi:trehalose/maltose hydrolase-like predicted phosphorylase
VSRTEKNAKGEYEIKNVVCADEYAENVDNNAFTNAGAITALRNAVKAAKEVGVAPDPQWSVIADNIPIRYFADSVVQEYETYNGQTIKQADANLLSYPLNFLHSPQLDKRNLEYYEPKVDKKDGPAMTYSIFSIVSSRLGEPGKAFEYFNQAYKPNKRPPFGVLAETATSNNPYFATGAGGMLQAVLFGFGGLNISDKGVSQLKTTLPKEWKKLTITGVGMEKKTFVVE